ncbi:TetR family transcriptional regulator [Rhodococcus sp. T2V]|uniref:TetR/AcrR family transcriptional regulator n=1 Tax=Rhodococcus sp. T2V TaxID=3034164 RepID=UPI0023E124FF|nr:TetR/AcrR family transcriptional regulator [Rhodococcus sp. T2V]MDF3308151.1 TetR family transcriptional regulator [Rhodococcus sp. T2V]
MDSRAPGRPKVFADSADKRDTILRSARELFSDRGFDRTTMRAIAKEAGVDPALIHHYFGNKDALLVAALQPEVDAKTVFSGITPDTDAPGEIFVRRALGDVVRSDHQDERYALVVRQTAGLAISKYILLLPDVANAPIEILARRVGPNIDNYLFSDFDG